MGFTTSDFFAFADGVLCRWNCWTIQAVYCVMMKALNLAFGLHVLTWRLTFKMQALAKECQSQKGLKVIYFTMILIECTINKFILTTCVQETKSNEYKKQNYVF